MTRHSLRTLLISTILLTGAATAAPTLPTSAPEPVPTVQEDQKKKDTKRPALKHYDVDKKGLAIGGYDPTSYFKEFGGKPKKGSKKITATHRGVTYRFVSEKSKKAFLANPERFEPAYGGWCAWAMSDGKGSKTEPSPKSFTIENGRLYLFYNGFFGNTKKSWEKKGSAPKLAGKADTNWERISGEKPASAKKTDDKKKKGDDAKKKGDGDA